MNKAYLAGIIAMLVGLIALGVVAINTALEHLGKEGEASPLIVHTNESIIPPVLPLYTTHFGSFVSDVATAEKIVGYAINLPSYLPYGNSLSWIKVNADEKSVFLAYSPRPVTDRISLGNLLDAKGIWIIYSVKEPGFDSQKWIHDVVTERPDIRKAITINGMPGEANEYSIVIDPYGEEYPIPAQVNFWRGNVGINLVADMPMTDLITVAESMR